MILDLSVFQSYLLRKTPSFFYHIFPIFLNFSNLKRKIPKISGIPFPGYYRKRNIFRFTGRNSSESLTLAQSSTTVCWHPIWREAKGYSKVCCSRQIQWSFRCTQVQQTCRVRRWRSRRTRGPGGIREKCRWWPITVETFPPCMDVSKLVGEVMRTLGQRRSLKDVFPEQEEPIHWSIAMHRQIMVRRKDKSP